MENIETFKLIGKLLEEADRYGRYVDTIIDSYDKQDLAPYFARKSASAALKALSLINQISGAGVRTTIFYFAGGKMYNNFAEVGWYFVDETEADYYGPFSSYSIADDSLEEYCRIL